MAATAIWQITLIKHLLKTLSTDIVHLLTQCVYAETHMPTEVLFLRQLDPSCTIVGLLHNSAKLFFCEQYQV